MGFPVGGKKLLCNPDVLGTALCIPNRHVISRNVTSSVFSEILTILLFCFLTLFIQLQPFYPQKTW